MAVDEQQLLQAVYDLIYDSLTQAPPGGGRPAANVDSTYLTLALPGMGLDEAQLANPWSPLNPNGLPAAAENLALLTDAVPVLSPVYSDSGLSVDKLYGQIVSANVAPSPLAARALQPAELFEAALATAPAPVRAASRLLYMEGRGIDTTGQPLRVKVETPRFRDYLEKRAVYNATVTRYMAERLQQRTPADTPPPPPVREALEALERTHPDELEDAAATANASGPSGVAALFSAARLEYELTRRGSLYQPGLFWHMCQALPANWLEPDAVFAQVRLSSEAPRLNPASRFPASGALALARGGLWRQRLGPNGPWAPRPLPLSGTRIQLSYRFARVEIRRPWLDPSLLSLGGWSMPGRPRHALSTGTVRDNPGIFSLLPSSMIVVRDLQVSAQWTREAAASIEQAVSQGTALALGPFALAGTSLRPGTARRLLPRFDGLTLSMPQLQLIGWLNLVVPASPPLAG